eukprot:gene7639-9144_t
MSEVKENEKKPEEVPQLEPLTRLYLKSNPIEQKFFNTPNRMAEVGWLPQWQIREAVRELLANMIDQARTVASKFLPVPAELEFTEEPGRFAVHIGKTLLAEAKWGKKSHKYIKNYLNAGVIKARADARDYIIEETQFLEMISYSSALPYTSFYVGHSTKRNNLAVIGKHGEGLTGACVVLNRAGCNIIAECTHNAYKAHIVRLKNDVCFQLERKRESSGPQQDTVRFTVVFDPRKPAEDMQGLMNCVHLPATAAEAGITTSRGILLLEPALRGKQFNRSIFVAEDARCLFGYDFLDPDKNLLEGRDRNAHGKTNVIKECGKIISEAILQSEEVRKEVLKCFMYGPGYNPDTPGEVVLTHYDDVKDGDGLTLQAVMALRRQYEQSLPVAGQKVVYCTRDTTMLNEVKRVKGMVSAYCHRVLHNHAGIVFDFQQSIKLGATVLDPTTRVGALCDQLLPLLGVRELKQSVMELPGAHAGLWVFNHVGYATCVRSLGAAHAVGLTEAQETSVIRSLRFAQIPVENEIKIIRLLRNQPEPEPEPEPELTLEVVPVEKEIKQEEVTDIDAMGDTQQQQQDGAPLLEAGIQLSEPEISAPEPVIPTATADASKEETDVAPTEEPLSARGPEFHDMQALSPVTPSDPAHNALPVVNPAAAEEELEAQDDISIIENEENDDVSVDSGAGDVAEFSDSEDTLPLAHTPAAALAVVPALTSVAAAAAVSATGAQTETVGPVLYHDHDGAGDDELVSVGDGDESAEYSDVFDLGEGAEEVTGRRVGELPSPKRQRLDRAGGSSSGTSSADTSVEVIDLSADNMSAVTAFFRPHPQLLQDLPVDIVLSDARPSSVHQISFYTPCGVWFYSDNADSEQAMVKRLDLCLPADVDRCKLRILRSLLHIVVFVTDDKRAPPAFNYGPHCVCINLGACGSEQMFKYILHAQLQAVNLME